jgi:hypothetical protein
MDFLIILLIILAILVICIYDNDISIEKFKNSLDVSGKVVAINPDKSQMKDINKVDFGPNLLNDKVFSDIITYQNNSDGRVGLDKCYEDCKGTCVEYGITGIAQCFPLNNPIKTNTNTIQNLSTRLEDTDRTIDKLVYPDLR